VASITLDNSVSHAVHTALAHVSVAEVLEVVDELRRRVRRLFAFGKGLLAVDTSLIELEARFRSLSIAPTPRMMCSYFSMLLGTPNLSSSVSGVVLGPELLTRRSGCPRLIDALQGNGVLAGVRADTGCESLSAGGQAQVTSGLDGLADRLSAFREFGASFAVWSTVSRAVADRAALRVLTANSQAAARFAILCQEMALVPVVRVGTRIGGAAEPRRTATTAAAALSVVGHLQDMDVDLGSVVISTHAGDALDPVSVGPLATLPAGLGGVALTRGWRDLHAAVDAGWVDALPWPVTFYVGREVTLPALRIWSGRPESMRAGQRRLSAELTRASGAPRRLFQVDTPGR
jgi:fructose-bisphosphate aldolase class I